MPWLQSLDASILRFVRETLRNPFFDWLMPLLSGKLLLLPAIVAGTLLLLWKGGVRGRVCLVVLGVVVLVGDNLICGPLKKALGRERPPGFDAAAEYRSPAEQISNHSMPSSHAANMFAVTAVTFLYFRRSWRFMIPLALGVCYSRIYKGAHYPTDVLAGAVLGACYGPAIAGLLDALWRSIGRRWFPHWCARLPSLLKPTQPGEGSPLAPVPQTQADQQWLRLGYLLIGALLLARLVYSASGRIELGIDEAYQWVWSKHLALSYYSKPPLIAYAQRLGTMLWGDTAFGVRFLSPVSATLVSWLLLRFLAREGYARAGFWLVLVSAATALLAVGATILTVDCLLVLFWTAAMVSGWRAVREDSLQLWLWTGLCMGLGSLSKYTALLQPLCWGIFFLLWKPARIHLRQPGPYLAVGVALLCTLPVWLWNTQHHWITLTHVATNARVDRPWKPSFSYFFDFTVAELALLNPVFFVGAFWAACSVVARLRRPAADSGQQAAQALSTYLFSMGAPLFLGYWLYTLHSKVQPNWIAASITPLFCLMAIHWEDRFRAGVAAVKSWLAVGLGLGLAVVIVMHDTNLVAKITQHPLPPEKDPLRQVRAWRETGSVVAEARAKLGSEGPPAFVICGHYGMTGELSFYMPEAKKGVPDQPLVYYQSSTVPMNQFYFWPGYRDRKHQNAIYVLETDAPQPAPEGIRREFATVKDAGMREIAYRGQIFRRLQIFECRDLQ